MDLSVYSRPRRFSLPHLDITRAVDSSAIVWAVVTGPFFFWRKGAMIEGFVVAAATLAAWALDADGLIKGVSSLVWLVAALLAPMLLAKSYERRGWVDVTDRAQRLDPEAIARLDAWSREAARIEQEQAARSARDPR